METKTTALAMLDEVTADMRLDYPGEARFRSGPDYAEPVRRSQIPYRVE